MPQIADELEVSPQALRNWVKQTELERGERRDGLTSGECEALRRRRREHLRLTEPAAGLLLGVGLGRRERAGACAASECRS
jgi:transposase-like protein